MKRHPEGTRNEKVKKLIVVIGLILAACLLASFSCAKAPPAPMPAPAPAPAESEPLALPEILDITITGYHSTRDIEGNYDPDHVEATLSWETNKPYYYCFEVRPVDFDYPTNSGGYEKFDVSVPLQEVRHSRSIILKSGKLHLYVLTVWDKEKNYITKSDTFWAPVVPKAPPPPAPAIAAPELVSPHNGATGIELRPRFLWKATNAKGYELLVSLNSVFSDIVIGVSMGDTAYQLSPDLRYYQTSQYDTLTPSTQYYWMVASKMYDRNTPVACSEVWTFTTSPPEAPALVTHTETIRASANSDYELPIYLDYGQQLCLSFSVEGGNPEWASVMVSFSEPDGNNLFYDDLHRDPAEHAPDLSLTSMHATRQGTFRYKAKESGFCLVTFHCCTSGRGTYVDVLVEYQKSL